MTVTSRLSVHLILTTYEHRKIKDAYSPKTIGTEHFYVWHMVKSPFGRLLNKCNFELMRIFEAMGLKFFIRAYARSKKLRHYFPISTCLLDILEYLKCESTILYRSI